MSSNQPVRSRRVWSLRLRLLVGQVVVLALVCVGITAATELSLNHHLMRQLDAQLDGTSHRSALLYPEPNHPGRHRDRDRVYYPRPGPGPRFLDAPGQPAGMVAAVVSDGKTVDAGYLTSIGSRAALSDKAQEQLAAIAGGRAPVTLDLDGLGRYRVVAAPSRRGGDLIVTGLSMSDVDATLLQMLVIFGIVTVIAIAAATIAGAVIIRRALAPLRRVAQTARRVSNLPLDRGEVELPVRVPESDANPATEVGQLASALNRMLDHIAAALSARQASETRVRQFVADASHELRTPLAAIRGYTELTQRMGDDREAVAHAMSRVASETERITRLVEDLLLLARLDSGRPLEREQVDLSRLAVDAVSDAHVAGPDHQWELDLPEEPVVVVGDAARLHQVLTNLLANARIHTGAGAVVTTRLSTDATHSVLQVIDNGPGIPKALQSEIFERFARGDTSRSRKGGSTGLGLAIVSAVVKAHNGTITVDSSPGRTEFTVRLPLDGWQPPADLAS
ncbi:sensor histidine kinase [Mycobacterium sherrisii]|uniref:histidine kinase n=1 Tax=Mycobacterium sherrisii TaxID=243061 RepID=A0A1E3SYU0_9MYCO|nr:HAMP domain-containing sensor histidine kinase [Mycobacterium sherrisii]MCV7029495.1 HAMP domain-containing histidine kinase [Mycobacterium sherrisii]MEC4761637.1 HAMP domain-containing sensor histidine kinase [Mycobacterium sherrisii]ODR07289.1 two-component sensor histidine kinase [Mycobacterium sherrisii]ORW77681.1 histidine kinase [Mycobacterium sherrisii]